MCSESISIGTSISQQPHQNNRNENKNRRRKKKTNTKSHYSNNMSYVLCSTCLHYFITYISFNLNITGAATVAFIGAVSIWMCQNSDVDTVHTVNDNDRIQMSYAKIFDVGIYFHLFCLIIRCSIFFPYSFFPFRIYNFLAFRIILFDF